MKKKNQIISDILNKIFKELDIDIKKLSESNPLDNNRKSPLKNLDCNEDINIKSIKDLYGDENKENEADILILGSYKPISSPGVVTFYEKDILNCCKYLICKILTDGISVGFDTICFPVIFVVEDIWYHEYFHCYCDYKKYGTDGFDRDIEEALAVAYSNLQIIRDGPVFLPRTYRSLYLAPIGALETYFWNNYQSINNNPYYKRAENIFNKLKIEYYSLFNLPGYKDWPNYANKDFYNIHVIGYTKQLVNDIIRMDILRTAFNDHCYVKVV